MYILPHSGMRYYVFVCFRYVSSFISPCRVMQYSRQNMSDNGHIVYTQNRKTVQQIYREKKVMIGTANSQKEVSTKLMKGLLDLIILQFLNTEPMHGYQVITKIRKSFGVYFGPSTIYPLLGTLEKKGLVKSEWNTDSERPRKIYSLTNNGQNMLNFTEESLNLICRKISTQTNNELTVETPHATVGVIARHERSKQPNGISFQIR
jgi:PadR family transcriptional regulator, regulatory protein PadR